MADLRMPLLVQPSWNSLNRGQLGLAGRWTFANVPKSKRFYSKGIEMVDTIVNLIGDNFVVAIILTVAGSAVGLIFLPLLFRTVLPGDPVSGLKDKFSNSYVRQPDKDLIEEAKKQQEEMAA